MPAPTTMEQIVHVLIRDDVPKVNYNYTHEEPGDPNMRFGVKNVMVIVTYANLIWISLLGNGVVFWKLYGRKNRSRVHFMLLHLCVADILVTVIEMPLQIAWKTTVQWRAGDTACRFLAGLRVVGLYLNAFLLIAISVDRFMSVWDPLSTARKATIRAKAMVFLSWILSVVCASPQLSVWSLKTHPIHSWYQQCVTFDAFQTRTAELAYGLLITILMYGLPLVTIIVCYLGIWLRISQYSRQSRQQTDNPAPTHNCNAGSSERLSCTTPVSQDLTRDRNSADFKQILINPHGDFLSKAKSRTLRMTALVVLIFIACWSPYQIIHIWFFVA
ncbi:adipokinetic hormone/corazonin-related peptide receptor variant I-like [Paramacrobiotus metropolitanus]|uniref:adipokinetic hormone/corazonin-related peptide receptor variant I-like n=1 Tax=Paramacrobiotus metropolitanus TaxID=2943436 RepID=UPI00244619E9|nr:adipokinetic hormone/corazonin-related peptide receptor variant I-like [Paramacrobiotus metropolitanus]